MTQTSNRGVRTVELYEFLHHKFAFEPGTNQSRNYNEKKYFNGFWSAPACLNRNFDRGANKLALSAS